MRAGQFISNMHNKDDWKEIVCCCYGNDNDNDNDKDSDSDNNKITDNVCLTECYVTYKLNVPILL